jgi:hypothetical protein
MALGTIINVNPGQGGMIDRDGLPPVAFAASDLLDGVACSTEIVGRKCSYGESNERADAGLPSVIS